MASGRFPRQLISIFGAGFALVLPVFFGLDSVLYSRLSGEGTVRA